MESDNADLFPLSPCKSAHEVGPPPSSFSNKTPIISALKGGGPAVMSPDEDLSGDSMTRSCDKVGDIHKRVNRRNIQGASTVKIFLNVDTGVEEDLSPDPCAADRVINTTKLGKDVLFPIISVVMEGKENISSQEMQEASDPFAQSNKKSKEQK